MRCVLLSALFFFASANALASPVPLSCTKSSRNIWYAANSQPKKGVLMLSHGLNVNALKMTDLIHFYTNQGYDVLLTILTGHDGNAIDFKNVTREQWLQDMYSAYCDAQARAIDQKLPIIFSGYSVSGLVAEDLIENYPELKVHFDKMVLFAPALAVQPISRLVKILNIFGKGYFVPSLSNPDYRVCEGTPIRAYDSLFDSSDRLAKSDYSHSKQTPTLVIIDPQDELVSEKGIKKIINSRHLDNWSLVELSNFASTTKTPYHHFIIAEEAVGTHVWQQTLAAIETHLNGLPQTKAKLDNSDLCGLNGKPWKTTMSDYCMDDSEDCDRKQFDCKPL